MTQAIQSYNTRATYNNAAGFLRQTPAHNILARNILQEFASQKKQRTNILQQEQEVVLVDMDGVLADYEGLFYERWREKHPDKEFIPQHKRKHFNLDSEMPHYAQHIYEIINGNDFFYKLEPIEGALEGIRKLAQRKDVRICTAPSLYNIACTHGKYTWVEKHLGSEWVQKVILTKDKTLITGNYLLDDKPEIEGAQEPTWEHIIYDQPYNRHIQTRRRATWKSIDDIM